MGTTQKNIDFAYYLDLIALVLIFLGSFNWGLIGLLEYDVVKSILNYQGAKVFYLLVGLSGFSLLPRIYKKLFK